MILTGNANETRAIPGQRYGVAAHSSSTVPAPPPKCSCPCHLNEKPHNAGVYCPECCVLSCACVSGDEETIKFTHDDLLNAPRDTRQWFIVGPPDYWFITKGNTLADELKKHYKTSEGAERAAYKLNLADVVADRGLDGVQEKRARAFGALLGRRSLWEDDEFWWVQPQGRYAIESGEESSSWSTVATLAEVEEEIRHDCWPVWRVVDLDTGQDVPFTRDVSVSLGKDL